MKQPITLYRVVRIDASYDPSVTSREAAIDEAVSQVVAEARSNAQYNGEQDGVEVIDVTDCGESA